MSLISDFDLAWKSYEDKLTSYAAQNAMKNKLTDADDFNNHYQQTIRMWDDESKVQGGFVTKWDNASPGFRDKFLSVINGYRFEPACNLKKVSPAPYIGIAVALSVIGGVIGYFIPGNFILKKLIGNIPVILISILVFTSAGGSIVKALYENSVAKKCKQCAGHFYSQIENLHMKLQDFCSKF